MHVVAQARFHHKVQDQDQPGRAPFKGKTYNFKDEQAATTIQACWRGRKQRILMGKKLSMRQLQLKPWGFYTHSLALVSTKGASSLPNLQCPASTRRWCWLMLEEPTSSSAAQALSFFIIFFIVLSIAGFILETVPEIYRSSPEAWGMLEVLCTGTFTLEYFARLAVCEEAGTSHIRFVISPMNVFDLMAVLPFYIDLVLRSMGAEDTPALRFFRLVRLVRVIRIFKLGRYATGMRLFGEALANSTTAISVLVFLLCMGVVLFSSALFSVEKLSCPEVDKLTASQVKVYDRECDDNFNRGRSPTFGLCCTKESTPKDFPSIISAFWWSLVTMTSVGYGEVYPRTTLGKCVGFVAMLVGMVLIALPVAIVGQKFQDVYENHDLEDAKRRAAVRMKVLGEVWSLVPSSDVGPKLKKLQIKDPALATSVESLTCYLEEVWEHREQLMRERKVEHERQEEIHSRVQKLLTHMETSLGCSSNVER
jgi:hypothetical protein